MAIAFGQGVANTGTTGSTTANLSLPATPGNLNVVATSDNSGISGGATPVVTDTAGNTYTLIPGASGFTVGQGVLSVFYAWNIKGGSLQTITVTWSTLLATRLSMSMQEFSGVLASADPLDVSVVGSGTSTSPSSGATATTNQADELVIGALARAGTAASTVSLGTGYTNLTTSASAAEAALESKVVSATGAQTAAFTLSASRSWNCGAATFKGAPPRVSGNLKMMGV